MNCGVSEERPNARFLTPEGEQKPLGKDKGAGHRRGGGEAVRVLSVCVGAEGTRSLLRRGRVFFGGGEVLC